MRIGIVGSGNMGEAFARLLTAAGHEVAISNSRGPDSLRGLTDELTRRTSSSGTGGGRTRPATVPEAVALGDAVLVAIPYGRLEEVLGAAGPFDGKVVVDVTNFYARRDGAGADPAPEASSVAFARLVPGARAVVKAFNTIWSEHLLRTGRPAAPEPERRALPIAGDDPEAKALVAGLVRELGFTPVDAGGLAESTAQEPDTPVYDRELTADEARDAVAAARRG